MHVKRDNIGQLYKNNIVKQIYDIFFMKYIEFGAYQWLW